MDAMADRRMHAEFTSIVAFISDSRRAALSQLLAERTSFEKETLLFAATTDELRRAVTSGSLVLIEGSRLVELAATGRVREAASAPVDHAFLIDPGHAIGRSIGKLPTTTRAVLQQALSAPRAWSVKRLAHATGISTRQLVRQFRVAGFSVSPKDFLLAARLAAAQALLRGARVLTTTEVAHACGWVDVRSLRAALRRAGLASPASLAQLAAGQATVSDLAARIADKRA